MKDNKIVSIEDRIPKLKEKRRRRRMRRITLLFSVVTLIALLSIYLLTPLSKIRNIEIIGNESVSEEEILSQSGITIENKLWRVNKNVIKKRVNELSLIKSVEVNRRLPSTIKIKVIEHKQVGYVLSNQTFQLVLDNGEVLTDETGTPGNAPIIHGFSDEAYFKKMIAELSELPKSILDLISEIHWQSSEENKNKVTLYMNDGYTVKATIEKFSERMQVYPSLVSQLEPDSKGVIHIGIGAYFEKQDNLDDDQESEENKEETEKEE